MERSPVANLKRDMTARTKEVKRDNSPSPVSYPLKEVQWRKMSNQRTIPSFTVMKEKQGRFLDKHVALKKFVPGVGTHKKTDIDSFLLLSRGPSPHYKRGI
jgi:hypothetical protein